ncbi:MAG: TniQ family protein [Ramlibacter sp.]|nr:TniQ family protein [Ramlibacter sp.]
MTRSKFTKEWIPHKPTWIVELPQGTSVQGAINVYRLLWGLPNREHAVKLVFEGTKAGAHNFETHAQVLSTTIFPHLTPRQVLEQHTVFGFFSRLLDERVAHTWGTELIERPDSGGALVRRYLTSQKMRTVRNELWFCPDCADRDQKAFGFSTWRYIHQLYGVAWCPGHGTPLVGFCRECGSAFDPRTSGRLPGEPCRRCGCMAAAPGASASEGSTQLAGHLGALIEGALPILRPRNFAPLVRAFIADAGGISAAKKAVQANLKQTWGTATPIGFDGASLEMELRLLRGASQGLERLLLYGAIVRLGVDTTIPSFDRQLRLLDDCLAKHNLPLGLGPSLQDRENVTTLARHAEVSALRIRAAIADLPAKVQGRVTPAQRRRVVPSDLSVGGSLTQAQLREKYRTKIQWAIDNFPVVTRTVLWHKLPLPMMWLSKHDRKWLDSIRPDKILRGTELFGVSSILQKRLR